MSLSRLFCVPQINVQASDLGTPPLTSENSATVTVNVKRNTKCPRFESDEYTKTIDETQGVNSQVLVVKAVDDDPQVMVTDLVIQCS